MARFVKSIRGADKFFNYFEKTWIGPLLTADRRRPPMFSHKTWNSKTITKLDLSRTTNSLESWHNSLRSHYNCKHPNIFKLMDGLLSVIFQCDF